MKDAENKKYDVEPDLTGQWYFAVIILFNNTFHLVHYKTKEEAVETVGAWVKRQPEGFVKDWYLIKRNLNKYDKQHIL